VRSSSRRQQEAGGKAQQARLGQEESPERFGQLIARVKTQQLAGPPVKKLEQPIIIGPAKAVQNRPHYMVETQLAAKRLERPPVVTLAQDRAGGRP
jgi:hypothetical protein